MFNTRKMSCPEDLAPLHMLIVPGSWLRMPPGRSYYLFIDNEPLAAII